MGLFSRKKQKSEAQSGIRITLERAGTPLYEIREENYTREIIIGRSPDCTWSLDGIDISASSRHATISRRKSHFYITDLGSRNGIFFQNKRIRERKLAVGDKISLGECILSVEIASEQSKRPSQFHRLVYVNEKGKRIIVNIEKNKMVLGSSSECDLIFQDQLISSQHAEISVKQDGSCWLKDLGSRNGTSVNGAELLPDSERMLQDNDLITIAYLDLRFWDASVEHQDSRIWSAVIAITVTVLIIMGGYIVWAKLQPNAEKYIEMVLLEMQGGRYDNAMKILTDVVPYSDGAGDVEYQRKQLIQQINQWKMTMMTWEAVKADLAAKRFSQATQRLGAIMREDQNTWTWLNGAAERRKAERVKALLDACSATNSCLKNAMSTVEDVESAEGMIENALNEASQYEDGYFQLVREYARPFLERIQKALKDDRELKSIIMLLDKDKPDYKTVISRLESISKDSGGAVKSRAERLLPAVRTLERETAKLMRMVEKVSKLEFKDVLEFGIDLPETIDYSTEMRVGTLKNELIKLVNLFKDTSLQLSLLYDDLVGRGISPGLPQPLLDVFMDETTLADVYRIDTLDMPLPTAARQKPSGNYDELLGVEFFFDYLNSIHEHTMNMNSNELLFKPKLLQLKDNLTAIEKFIAFSDRSENQWFNQSKFADFQNNCKEILKTRDRIIRLHLERKDAPESREYLISRGIAAFLLSDGDEKRRLEGELGTAFSALKRKIQKLNKDYTMSLPADQLKIREEIIRKGLPGDAVVKRMWGQRPASGWSWAGEKAK